MAMNSETTSDDLLNHLRKWVSAEALKIDNIEKYDLKIYGTDDKADHYSSDIAFVDISAENFNGERREYNLVIKYGIKNKNIGEKMPIREAFRREIDIYNKILPFYHKFQQEKKLPLFAAVPKCYLTKFTETEEVIVLENLKPAGYKMHERQATMNLDHMKLVLKAYAEWHALSFAVKDQKCEDIEEVTKTWNKNPLEHFILSENGKIIDECQQYLYEILQDMEEIELLGRYKEKIGNKSARNVMLELLRKEESQSVVLHADCWNNNFLFKYESDDEPKTTRSNVALLDFQLSFLHSPAFDISHFIYAVASSEELNHLHELLNDYYNHFANHLRLYGSDPEKLFSFSDLIVHFQKYFTYGAIMNPIITFFALVDKEDAPDFGKSDNLDAAKKLVQKKEYRDRVFNIAKHFVENEF